MYVCDYSIYDYGVWRSEDNVQKSVQAFHLVKTGFLLFHRLLLIPGQLVLELLDKFCLYFLTGGAEVRGGGRWGG